ncbi:hypothetical protein GCM10010885_03700 [Alicyclobacillus cellulosilyticus]|uniref:Uncharacterized protein n=1 Tax=Alicyclobacillus cellulosilyticus TaxID=1003997 RepID=A0A917K1J4_9BACL|nr:DUF5665 domain-containing protein [Alicyclobacillus cellulosilyticus]GGI97357.1 hypothetical protein GCM10010885_03700 [Alicyclobacillus cellulosilyticus]
MAEGKRTVHEWTAAEAQRLAAYLERANFAAYADLLQRPWRLAFLNWFGGLFRGFGIGIGFTIVAALVIMLLQWLEILNLPVIGRFIAELVRIVQAQLRVPTI